MEVDGKLSFEQAHEVYEGDPLKMYLWTRARFVHALNQYDGRSPPEEFIEALRIILGMTRKFEKLLLERKIPFLIGTAFREHAKDLEEMLELMESVPPDDLRRILTGEEEV